jgi:hypothetical protein
MLPAGDDLTIIGILISVAFAFGGIAMTAAGWKHPFFIRTMFVLAGISAFAGLGWPWLKTVTPASLADALREVSQSPAVWFCLLLVAVTAYALYRRPRVHLESAAPRPRGEQQQQPRRAEPSGKPWIVAPMVKRYGDPQLFALAMADLEGVREVEGRARAAKAQLDAVITFGGSPSEKLAELMPQAWKDARARHIEVDEECSAKRRASDASYRRLLDDIYKKLYNGSLVAKGFLKPVTHTSEEITIPASHWRFLRFNALMTEAEGQGIAYTAISVNKN